jgi:DNA polymerase
VNEELSELASDVREYLRYLNELGIEGLDVELEPEREPAESAPVAAIARDKIERFVPVEPIAPRSVLPAEAKTREAPASGRRLDLLDSVRVADVRPAPHPEPRPSKPVVSDMPKPTEPMVTGPFGDSRNVLPETGETIESIRADIGDCRRCSLWEGRTKIAHSTGSFSADLMFVGEAPGADEDAQGAPFVGRAGQLLTKIIEAIGYRREDVFIGNINRCRPPANRAPLPDETATCKPFLLREIAVVRPKVIVVLGNTAMKNLLDTREGITKLRGIFQEYYGIKVMPTFHPAYLLRDPSKKREVWDDMKKVRDYLSGDH